MADNVENMMYVRETPWHGLGTMVQDAPTSADALHLAGLDWRVTQKNIQVCGGVRLDGYKANIRSSDNKVLGVVTDRYRVVQNEEAFAFTDSLVGGEVRYETAGSLCSGKRIWLLAKLPETEIVGDKTEPYVCFTNTHDGSSAIRVCMTPIRVVCNNTLNLALNSAKRSWSVKHVGNIQLKLHEAQHCLDMACTYMDELNEYADQLANTTVSDERIRELLNELFPLPKNATPREAKGIKKLRDEYMICYFAPDIQKFRNTAWGVVNAMSDMITHNAPRRQTANYRENNWGRIMDGHIMLDKTVQLLTTK